MSIHIWAAPQINSYPGGTITGFYEFRITIYRVSDSGVQANTGATSLAYYSNAAIQIVPLITFDGGTLKTAYAYAFQYRNIDSGSWSEINLDGGHPIGQVLTAAAAQTTHADYENSYKYGFLTATSDPVPADPNDPAFSGAAATGSGLAALWTHNIGKSDGVPVAAVPRKGVLTNVTTGAVEVASATWVATGNKLIGLPVTLIRAADSSVETQTITDNTATILLVAGWTGTAPAIGDTIVIGAVAWKIWNGRLDCGYPFRKKAFSCLWFRMRFKTVDAASQLIFIKVFLDGKAAKNTPLNDRLSLSEAGVSQTTSKSVVKADAKSGYIRFQVPLNGAIGVDIQFCIFGYEADAPVEILGPMELQYALLEESEYRH